MQYVIDALLFVAIIYFLWTLQKASNAACDTRDILKRMMKEYDQNNDLPKV